MVSGRDAQEVRRAATALAFMSQPFPEDQKVLVRDLELPDLPPGAGPDFIPGGRALPISVRAQPPCLARSPLPAGSPSPASLDPATRLATPSAACDSGFGSNPGSMSRVSRMRSSGSISAMGRVFVAIRCSMS
ncbi:hypothetical protein [Caldichromatium japonicum]|uniref:hypothetical protein n=1 Tax=Caldichromatium japonicum TaxID=2699430 RepID=UPI003CCCB97B